MSPCHGISIHPTRYATTNPPSVSQAKGAHTTYNRRTPLYAFTSHNSCSTQQYVAFSLFGVAFIQTLHPSRTGSDEYGIPLFSGFACRDPSNQSFSFVIRIYINSITPNRQPLAACPPVSPTLLYSVLSFPMPNAHRPGQTKPSQATSLLQQQLTILLVGFPFCSSTSSFLDTCAYTLHSPSYPYMYPEALVLHTHSPINSPLYKNI
jgi:hypothetical protein